MAELLEVPGVVCVAFGEGVDSAEMSRSRSAGSEDKASMGSSPIFGVSMAAKGSARSLISYKKKNEFLVEDDLRVCRVGKRESSIADPSSELRFDFVASRGIEIWLWCRKGVRPVCG